jgi:hypothetical protein
MKQKIIYFSAVHGTGKTTLIKEIAENYLPNAVIVDLDQFQLYPKDYLHQQIYRLDIWEETLRNTQGDILLVDRSPYDGLMYSKTLWHFQDISGFSYDDYKCVEHSFFSRHPEYRNSGYIVYLQLGLQENFQNIIKRGSEDSDLMFNQYFIEKLWLNFRDLYEFGGLNVSKFEGEYNADSIVQELLRKCILQPSDIYEEKISKFKRENYQKN